MSLVSSLTLLARDYAHLVNPFVGTDYTGNTYPGVQLPFGMVQLSPDNLIGGWDRIAGYFYPDGVITGFSHTHLDGTGAGDMYDISFMPTTSANDTIPESKFSHDSEQASAGFYQVYLNDYNIEVTLAATPRCGVQRYVFPPDCKERIVVLNLSRTMNWDRTTACGVEQTDSVHIRGYRFSDGWARNQRVYFATRFSEPPVRTEIDSVAGVARFYFGSSKTSRTADDPDALLTTNDENMTETDRPIDTQNAITIVTALSGTGIPGAERNLAAEGLYDDIGPYIQLARHDWNYHLGVIDVTTDNQEKMRKFYTALYHSMLAPTIYSDVDGRYLGPDRHIHRTKGTHYSTFSLWDTYRTAHPLFTLTCPERVKDMVQSLIDFGEQNGRLPVWNMWASETDMMIGYHAAAVIADAVMKGFKGIDAEAAFDICHKTAQLRDYRSIGTYIDKGYVPTGVDDMGGNDDWSMSRTLEYAYDDACIARLANCIGRKKEATYYNARAKNYENVFDSKRGFFVPRHADGSFERDFNPDKYGPHICESNGWMYLWSVQHDIPGLCHLLGGKKKMKKKLDTFFSHTEDNADERPLFSTGMIGQYAHGNEPSHHVAYLYNYVGHPSRCQEIVSKICRDFYRDTPDGLCGNEDCGQTSAWFVMSAMGIYPVDPVGGKYEIGTPLFPELTLHLENGGSFHIIAPNVDEKHLYVRGVLLNGEPYDFHYITDDVIQSGGTLTFIMSDKPCPKWW